MANQLARPAAAALPTTLTQPLAPRVESSLESNTDLRFPTDGGPAYYAGWLPAKANSLPVDELKANLARLEIALSPAPPELTVMLLTRLAAHYWNERGEAQWDIVFDDYSEDLSALPADVLAEAIARYRRKGKFWPKVAELLAEGRPLLDKRRTQYRRLCKVLDLEPRPELIGRAS